MTTRYARDPQSSGYANVRIGLRAPRVAVVFDGGDQWSYWARLALHAATQTWGGAGFILIPHIDGDVEDCLLTLTEAYDPDHVVLLQPTVVEHERAVPGRLPITMNGKTLEGSERTELIATIGDHATQSGIGERARSKVAAACSPHRRRHGSDPEWFEDLTHLKSTVSGRYLTPMEGMTDGGPGLCLAAPPDWGGLLGVAAAARCGAVLAPNAGSDPDLEASDLIRAVSWLLSPRTGWNEPPDQVMHYPTAAMSVNPGDLPTALTATMKGLTWIQRGFVAREATLLVYGDAAPDFALALGWDRLYGRAIWLPSSWSPIGQDPVARSTALALNSALSRAGADQVAVRVVSTSATSDDVDGLLDSLRKPLFKVVALDGTPIADDRPTIERLEPAHLRFAHEGRLHLGVADQYEQQLALPVTADEEGGYSMPAPPPPPAIQNEELAGIDALSWQVDVEFLPGLMPRGRGLDGRKLLADGEDSYLTWVRSGRDGISYQSHRFNLVLAGTPPLSRLARPRLRQLGLLAWVRHIAAEDGVSVSLSPAGRRVEILRRLMGSRGGLAELIASPLLPALHAFQPNARASKGAYPAQDGVVLAPGEGLLTFAGIATRAPGLDVDDLRFDIDTLLERHIMRRGLVLDCGECESPTFVSVDDLAQVNRCPRCGANNELTRPRWREPRDEPTWFYDLHPAARELLRQDGDVPLLLAAHLRGTSRNYVDIAEVEATASKNAKPLGESDLVALCDDDLVVAEAKSVDNLGRSPREARRTVAKRLAFAQLLRANQLVMATAATDWGAASVTAIREVVSGSPHHAKAPIVRLVTGLGSEETRDERLDVATGTRATWS
jgi:hypothetical protein